MNPPMPPLAAEEIARIGEILSACGLPGAPLRRHQPLTL
ncbi:hypothetical protein TOK_2838 [Pseudonocardia sp. N23]|nr:hypothetical protein TOK_2838 [Pseudonocardia sp. N23]